MGDMHAEMALPVGWKTSGADMTLKSAKSEFEGAGVFLSHSHEDHVFAIRLGNDLAAKGLHVWIDSAEV